MTVAKFAYSNYFSYLCTGFEEARKDNSLPSKGAFPYYPRPCLF